MKQSSKLTKIDLLITGVGGQGNILASDIVSEVALASGYDVKKTDTLGMAQRGGSVISHVRIAEKVFSPLIKEGEVDILLAFEKLEGVRWASYLKPGGIAIVNNHALPPLSVNLGVDSYPDDKEVIQILKQRTDRIYFVEGTRRVIELGNVKTLNIFMLGCLSSFLPFKPETWQEVIARHLPAKVLQLNKTAFETGSKEIKNVHVG
ncbi:MAG: indolepyruvate oxidoreductase subunit beta [Dehalococcoidales bacterium]|nr:indolepyruvate oxidoreductase subunit beta [Dehalococcoidales bacterium]